MDPISVVANIIAILQLSNKVVGYLIDAKHASKDKAKCAVEAANLNSLLTVLRFRLEDEDKNSPWFAAMRRLGVKNGPLDQFKQALEELHNEKAGSALVWKFKKEEIAGIMDRIERLKSLVEISLQMDHFKLSQAIKASADGAHTKLDTIQRHTKYLQSHIPVIQSGLDTLHLHQDQVWLDKICAWLSTTDFSAFQSDTIHSRQRGTGYWFLEHPMFLNWLDGSNKSLFCPGIPGSGKTMASAIAIDYLLREKQSSDVAVAYVYCSYKSDFKQTAASLLGTIIRQLLQACPANVDFVESLHVRHTKTHTRPSVDELSDILLSIVSEYHSTYFIVDALDECYDRDGTALLLLNQLQSLQGKANMRLMVTSRFVPEIRSRFKDSLSLQIRASDDDVKTFVTGQIHRLPKCIQNDTTLQDAVRDKVAEAVDGMFLLARLHVDSLLDKRTKSKVHSTLNKLCGGTKALDIAYDAAVERIHRQLPEDTALAIRVLSWITNAQRPLTTTEICHALAVELDDKDFDPDNVPNIDDLVSTCAGLVTVDEESNIIRLVHYTTQEYFERIQPHWNPGAQQDMASICIKYMSFDSFKNITTRNFYRWSWRKNHPFLGYAAHYWGHHALPIQDDICESACSFLLHGQLLSCTTQIMETLENSGPGHTTPGGTALHLTAIFGLQHLMKEILMRLPNEGHDLINASDNRDRTPLSLAAEYGHVEFATLLLDHGAVIDPLCGDRGTPLETAALYGHEAMVDLLLARGAKFEVEGSYFSSTLQAAAYGGSESTARSLLRKGASINAHNARAGSALQAALYMSHISVAQLLIEEGADIHVQGDNWGNALHIASARGHEQLVSLLLDKGARINEAGTSTCGALQEAASRGHEGVVKILLNAGAKNQPNNKRSMNALEAAALYGQEQIVELLLDSGIDVNAQSERVGGALQAASREGHIDIVALLINRGANVNAADGRYGSPLQGASSQDFMDIVLLLLQNGADINASGGRHGSVLNTLAFCGQTQLLREAYSKYNADMSSKDDHRRTPLHFAAKGGHLGTYLYLREIGLDASALDAKGDDALSYAASGGSLKIVNAILGQDKVAQTQKTHWNALHWAFRSENPRVVEPLLNAGMRSNCIRIEYPQGMWDPVSIAIFHDNQDDLYDLPDSFISLLDSGVKAIRCKGHNRNGRFMCDGCLHDIYGPRFHCLTCKDFDYCLMCKPFLTHLHGQHEWECLDFLMDGVAEQDIYSITEKKQN